MQLFVGNGGLFTIVARAKRMMLMGLIFLLKNNNALNCVGNTHFV
jgi:hypothetical protein